MEHVLSCILQYGLVRRGNQHGSLEYDDFQNLLDMTSHENVKYCVGNGAQHTYCMNNCTENLM